MIVLPFGHIQSATAEAAEDAGLVWPEGKHMPESIFHVLKQILLRLKEGDLDYVIYTQFVWDLVSKLQPGAEQVTAMFAIGFAVKPSDKKEAQAIAILFMHILELRHERAVEVVEMLYGLGEETKLKTILGHPKLTDQEKLYAAFLFGQLSNPSDPIQMFSKLLEKMLGADAGAGVRAMGNRTSQENCAKCENTDCDKHPRNAAPKEPTPVTVETPEGEKTLQ